MFLLELRGTTVFGNVHCLRDGVTTSLEGTRVRNTLLGGQRRVHCTVIAVKAGAGRACRRRTAARAHPTHSRPTKISTTTGPAGCTNCGLRLRAALFTACCGFIIYSSEMSQLVQFSWNKTIGWHEFVFVDCGLLFCKIN